MRIFIGISLSKELEQKIIRWQERYQDNFKTSGVRFISTQNLHITLVPPWHVDDTKDIVEALDQEVLGNRFNITFTKILFIPPEKSKYVWAFGSTPEELGSLRLNITQVLRRPIGKRKYALHTTIARMQNDAKFENLTDDIHWSMIVNSFSLFRSFLSPNGAEYEEVKRFSLENTS